MVVARVWVMNAAAARSRRRLSPKRRRKPATVWTLVGLASVTPYTESTPAAASSMASRLATKRRKAPRAQLQRPAERQSPHVASGGTTEVAMATPGSAGLMRGLRSA